jgi:hypothetical protein
MRGRKSLSQKISAAESKLQGLRAEIKRAEDNFDIADNQGGWAGGYRRAHWGNKIAILSSDAASAAKELADLEKLVSEEEVPAQLSLW